MADAAPAPTDDLEATYRQLLQQTVAPPAAPQPQGPTASSHEGRGWLSLLGEALGGGQEYGTTAERETGGIRALGALGQRMLAASDYSYTPHTLGSIIGQGMGAAGESLAQTGSVDASRVAALQDYQQKQQEMQLARVKEAVPILTAMRELQKQKALAGLGSPLGGTTPGTTPGTSLGAVGGDTYEGAIGGHEGTGKNPNSSALGTGQFLESTWQAFAAANPDLFKGMTPAQVLAARTDPKLGTQAITWLAQQNAAELTKAGVAPTGPSLGVAHYLGAGATAKLWAAPDNAPVAGFVSADAVKANPELATMTVGQLKARYANTPAPAFLATAKPSAPQTPPPASTAQAAAPVVPGGGGPLTPRGAPQPSPTGAIAEATRAAEVGPLPLPATAGKGTILPAGNLQTTGKPPGVASNVEAMQAGINLAQATPVVPGTGMAAGPPGIGQPATLASAVPGGGSGFASTTPPAVAAPQAPTQAQQPPPAAPVVTTGAMPRATPESVPDSYEEFRQQHPIVPSDEDRAGFSTAPDAAQLALLQRQAQLAKYAIDVARTQGDAPGLAKATEAYNTILASENTVRENANKAGADRRAAWFKDQDAQLHAEWMAAQTEKQKRITQQQQADQTFRLKQEEGAQTRLTNKEAVFNQANQKGLETAQSEQANARDVVTQLEGFRAISDNVGQPNWLQTTKFPGTDQTIAEKLGQMGYKLDDTGGVQLLRGGITNLVKTLRAGMPMGSLSDRDLSFVERMGPTEWMDPDTRTAAVSYLQQAYKAKMAFARDVQKEMSRGKNYGDAMDAADANAKPFVPAVPADLSAHWKDDPRQSEAEREYWKQQRIDWAQKNDVRPGTLYHMYDGSIAVMRDPNRKLKTEQR